MKKLSNGRIVKVSGPLVIAEGMRDADMFDVVRVSDLGLIGEIIEMHGDRASIQVYEETAGLGPGEPVLSTGAPLSVELAPGLVGEIFDGIQRPLERIRDMAGNNIPRGIQADVLDRTRQWDFVPSVQPGDEIATGDILGTVQETSLIVHRILVPHGVRGTVTEVLPGARTIVEPVVRIRTPEGDLADLPMLQRWPVRRGRPYAEKITPRGPMITGQRAIDTFFPIARGGTAAIPGPFGSGKTVIQHQLAKWSDVDLVVYIGCGERGNEMTDVLMEFPELKDPKSGESLMKRTVLIANTSDMPVAAREASIYTGITIAEYFRDMGYNVAIMADSTSRWAEALREMSGRLEEMPGEEGYPAYLGSRLAQFYERAGHIRCLASDHREGTLTAIGAVSPPGGDLSDPVAQATLRIVKVFWGLDSSLAYKRHFPAINWLTSYSLYADRVDDWMDANVSPEWHVLHAEAIRLLQEEAELEEIVKLVGLDSLSPLDQFKLEAARSLREDYLQQDSFDDVDTYASLDKKLGMLQLVMEYYRQGVLALDRGVPVRTLIALPVRDLVARLKFVPEDRFQTAAKDIRDAYLEQFRSGQQGVK